MAAKPSKQEPSRAGTDHVDGAPDGRLVGAPHREVGLDDLHGHERAREAADARAAHHARLRGQPDESARDRAQDRAHCPATDETIRDLEQSRART